MLLPHQLWGGRVLCRVVPLSWFPGILFCRFPCLLLWFFVTLWARAMHVPLRPSLVLSLYVLNACLVLNSPFYNSKISLLKTGYISTIDKCDWVAGEEVILSLGGFQLCGWLWEVVPKVEGKKVFLSRKRSFCWPGSLGSGNFACNSVCKIHETSSALVRKQL